MATTAERTKVRLGTATPGGGFPVYGAAYAAALNESVPTLEVEPVHTKGSTENVPLLEAGQIDIGQVTGEVAHEAMTGVGRPPAKLYIVSAMYPSAGMFIVRADSPHRTLGDLTGQPVVWGARGIRPGRPRPLRVRRPGARPGPGFPGGLPGQGRRWAADGARRACRRVLGRRRGLAGIRRRGGGPAGARFIAPGAADIARIVAKHPFIKPVTLPAGSYAGQAAPVPTVGSWSFVLSGPSLPDDVAYRLARALHRGEAALGARLAQARESTLANTLAAAPRPDSIHPGGRRYMREVGILS